MADRKPLKVLPDGGGDSAGLSEFVAADTVGIADGGTGAVTASAARTALGVSPTAGSSSIVTTGALDSGSITSGFGTIDTGSSSITTTGAISSGALTATGNVSLNGGSFVFNEAGADKDFRIEGDSEANLFFVDASTDRVGIGTATPASHFEVILSPGNYMRLTDPSGSVNASEAVLGFYGSSNGTTRLGYLGFGSTSHTHMTLINDQSANLSLGTAATEFFRMNSTGSVAMGTTLSENYGLAVTWGNANSALRCYNTTQGGSALQVYDGHASTTANLETWGTERSASTDYNMVFSYTGGNGNNVAFKFRGDHNGYADGGFHTGSGDYAEYFESTDGTAIGVGTSVVMDGGKVRAYNVSSDDAENIIGVTRPKEDGKISAFVGNEAWSYWHDKYLTDDWGVYLREDVTVWEWDEVKYAAGDVLPEGKEVGDVKIEGGTCYEYKELAKDSDWTPPAGATSSTQSIRKQNPAFDESREDDYKSREDRAEWNLIGLLGQVPVKANEPVHPRWIKMKQISDAVDLWMVR